MSSTKWGKCLKAAELHQSNFTCAVCSELCKDPVLLSICLHLICYEHFKELQSCPTCNVPLKGCTVYRDDRLESCISNSIEILKLLRSQKHQNVSGSEEPTKQQRNSDRKAVAKSDVPVKDLKAETSKSSRKHAKKGSVPSVKGDSKENISKPNLKNSLDLNVSKTSIDSKLNKTIEKRNTKGETALHMACRLGKLDKVAELLECGANTNTKDNAGWTPLHEAVQSGRLDLVKLLLQHNTLIDVPGASNETPLHEAVRYNFKEIAEVLVQNGADIDARNCKGETPLQLAKDEMKDVLETAAENVLHTQSINIDRIAKLYAELEFESIVVYCVTEFRTTQNKLKSLMKHHKNLHVETKFTKKVTHLLVDADDDGVCTSTLDVLQAIVSNIWILTTQWIMKSTEDKLQDFTTHEVTGIGTKTYKGHRNARLNKYKQFPGIFDGCHIYLHNFTTKYEISKQIVVTKAILAKLITDAGGIVLRRIPHPELIPEAEKLVPYHAKKGGRLTICSHYIVYKDMYEPTYDMAHIKALPIGWLIECIEKYELCEPW